MIFPSSRLQKHVFRRLKEEMRYVLKNREKSTVNFSHTLGVLGCTGSVGQRFILLLAEHPTLSLHAIGASSRSAGKEYREAVKWKQSKPMSAQLAGLVVRECKASNFTDCDLVFSGLDSDVAGDIGKVYSLLHRHYAYYDS